MKLKKEDVTAQFKKCGVSKGDIVFLHSDALGTSWLFGSNFEEKADTLFDGILDLIGPNGTLILPTFTYSATKGEVFNVQETKSEVGILTEYFRNKPGVKRSLNPIFSVAVIGGKANEFLCSSIDDCFGYNSCFGLLYNTNSWIFTLGCSFNRITFIHFVDQVSGVDHRFFKIFQAGVINENTYQSFNIKYLVRNLERKSGTKLDYLKSRLVDEGKLHKSELGQAVLFGVKARDFYQYAIEMIKKKSNVHIEEGYEI